jgi:protein O-mannosyl-transferase
MAKGNQTKGTPKIPLQKQAQAKVTSPILPQKDNMQIWLTITAVAITLVVFFPSLFNGFVLNWDDATYVHENDTIQALKWLNIKTMFTTYHNGNYHPLTELSYAIEYAFVGIKPFLYHLDNLILHLVNVFLVFVFTKKLTKRNEIAFITALLFGIHPMRVESVAWVSERKDVLYTAFFMLAGIMYLDFVQKPLARTRNYILTIVFILISILSKPAAVCFPGVVVLIDWFNDRKFTLKVILEKIPFFVISLIFGIVAVNSQKEVGAIQNLAPIFTILDRVLLSFRAIELYISKFFLPIGLSAMHPYPPMVDGHMQMNMYLAPVVDILLIIPAIISYRKTKMILFGTLFFFVNIVLVLQILPVGAAMIAERYSYVPYIGLFMMLGYGYVWISDNKKEFIRKFKILFLTIVAVWTIYLGYTAFNRIKVWYRGDYLFEDILLSYQNQPFVYNNLGFLCFNELKDMDRAMLNYNRCIAVDSTYDIVYGNRGILFFNMGKYPEALSDFNKAIKYKPDHANAIIGRANTYSSLNQFDKALVDYNTFIALVTNNPSLYRIGSNVVSAHHWRGIAECNMGKYDDAIRDFNIVLANEPNRAETYYWRGLAFNYKKMVTEAISDISKAINLDPTKSEMYAWRGLLYYNTKNNIAAIADYSKAIALNPKDIASLVNRAISYKETKQWVKALADLDTAGKLGQMIDRAFYVEVLSHVKPL